MMLMPNMPRMMPINVVIANLLSFSCFQNPHNAVRAIHFHQLPIFQHAGGIIQPGDAWDAIFARHDCAVLQRAADFQDDASGIDEQRRPAGVGGAGDQDFAGEQFLFAGMTGAP